ncbi:MAG: PepSY-associated TM helix domain-containing protein [Bacteroidota bacterium]
MKLKALKPRLHNIMFHTHTVSGIVISFVLFIIFYAGAYALFMDELSQWENPNARIDYVDAGDFDYDKALTIIHEKVPNLDFTKNIGITTPTASNPLPTFNGFKTLENGESKRFYAHINPNTYEIDMFDHAKTHMAQTIYELHFFNQIPFGIYIAGLAGFFFIFAIFTGLLTHWKNIVNKFYAFTTKGKWKQIWTNGHISLGLITLPFQMIYAVTGALLGLSILLLIPTAFLAYNGDTNAVLAAVRPDAVMKYDVAAKDVESQIGFNNIYTTVHEEYPAHPVTYMYSTNFGKEDGTIGVRVDDHKGISGDGTFIYSYKDGSLLSATKPDTAKYSESTLGILIKLHYATYGGIFLKIIYFILAMITCYIISSGVMIWRTARDNKKYTDKQRRFHHKVTKTYLAITLSMFPAVGLIFIANKLVPLELTNRIFYVNTTFFVGWLLLTIVGLFWNNYRVLNRNYIIIGSVLALLIPVTNGVVTGDWIWNSLVNQQLYVFSVDLTWLIIGVAGILIVKYYLKASTSKNVKQKITVSKPKLLTHEEPVLQSTLKKSN